MELWRCVYPFAQLVRFCQHMVFETQQRVTFLTRSLLWSTLGAAPKQEPSLGCPVPPYCSSPEQMQLVSHAYRPVNWFHLPSLSCSTWVMNYACSFIELVAWPVYVLY